MIPIVTDCSNNYLVKILLQCGGISLPGWQHPGLGARISAMVKQGVLIQVNHEEGRPEYYLLHYILTEKGRALFIHVGVELPPMYPCGEYKKEMFMYDPVHAEAKEIL